MTGKDDVLAQVAKFLDGNLSEEGLSKEVEKSRQSLLELVNKHLASADRGFLREKCSSPRRSNRHSCDVRSLGQCPDNSKRQSKERSHSKGEEHSDSCDGSGYESMDDRISVSSVHSDKKPDAKSQSKSLSKLKLGGDFPSSERIHEGYLYKKGKLNSWRKLYCVMHDKWLICFTKDSKQLYRIKLEGYDISQHKGKESGKYEHEVRLTGPGLKTYSFHAKTKIEADVWAMELTKVRDKIKEVQNPTINYESPRDDQRDEKSENAYDMVDGCLTGNHGETKETTSGAKPSIFHNLISRVRQRAMAAFDSLDNSGDKLVSGTLQVTFDDLARSSWCQKFCQVRSKNLEVHCKNSAGAEKPEMILPLPGTSLTLMPINDFFVLCLNRTNQKMFIKFHNHTELNRWYQVLQRASQVLPELPVLAGNGEEKNGYDVCLYDEIGDSDRVFHRPNLPECPPPATPDVTGALMNMDEVGYMDVLECRQPIPTTAKQRQSAVVYEDVSVYVNRDTNHKPKVKSFKPPPKTSAAAVDVAAAPAPCPGVASSPGNTREGPKSVYCPMSRGRTPVIAATSVVKPPSTTATTAAAATAPSSLDKSKSSTTTTGLPSTRKVASILTASGSSASGSDFKGSGISINSGGSNGSCCSAKKSTEFNEARGKFIQSETSSPLSNRSKPAGGPAPNKWMSPLTRNVSSPPAVTEESHVKLAAPATSVSGPSSLTVCQMRSVSKHRSPSRSLTPIPDGDGGKRNSEMMAKSNLIQEKMKIFQNK